MRKRSIIVSAVFFLFVMLIIFSLDFKEFGLTGKAIYENQPGPVEGKDAYIRQDFPDNNFGSMNRMGLGMTSGSSGLRALMFFNYSSIPSDHTVVSGKIQIHLNESSGRGPIGVDVYRLTADWNESEVTWNSRNSSELWNSAGGDYYPEKVGHFVLEEQTGFYNITLTDVIQDWVRDEFQNSGIILIANNSVSDGQYGYIDSSESSAPSKRPKLIVEHTLNAPPSITNISHDSTQNNPKETGENISFSVGWNDLEDDETQTFICNSSDITISGCQDKTFCETNSSLQNPATCSYTIEKEDNRTTPFWVMVCDPENCSSMNQSYFYTNDKPNITLIQPNGGEEINQTRDGNYTIRFNVSDYDGDHLIADLYYNESSPGTSNTIKENLNLSLFCTDSNFSQKTDCSYSWNTSGIYGKDYYLTVIVNDSFYPTNDSSDSNFSVFSVVDPFPPNISEFWIQGDYHSGGEIEIFANVTDENLEDVWATINTVPESTIYLNEISQDIFSGTWIAEEPNDYQVTIHANDIMDNQEDSNPLNFDVYKPNATALNLTCPEKAVPYHTIKVSTKLNASNSLKDVYAYLHVPDEFGFMEAYPQNNYLGNFSGNEIKTSEWFLSVPLEERTYNINVSFTDKYSNQWRTSNKQIQVTSSAGDYDLNLEGYSEVVGGEEYYAEATFDSSDNYINPDSMEISLYDAIGNQIIDSVSMTREERGKYNYTYTVPSSATEGQWETIVNATMDSESYFANSFWKVVGGPFDIRNIQIQDSSIEELEISVETENTGDLNKDLFLEWNLTREDTGEQLDAGMDTFMVPANSNRTWTVNPTTSYLGDVRITFIGFYSDGERAGAYRIFSTTEGGEDEGDEGDEEEPATGGGGGGISTQEPTGENLVSDFEFIEYPKAILLTEGFDKKVIVKINNTGNKTLYNLNLELEGLISSFYTITPKNIDVLKPNRVGMFEINFEIEDFQGENEFFYNITSEEISKKEIGKINVLPVREYFLKEIEKLRDWIAELLPKANEENEKRLRDCERIVDKAETNMYKENYIQANEQLKQARECIKRIENKIEQQKEDFSFEIGPGFFLILTWILILILILIGIIIVYKLNREFSLIDYFNKKTKTPIEKSKPEKDLFYKKMDDIKKKLGEKEE